MQLQKTFSALQVNRLILPNRILMSSMHLNIGGPDKIERMARFYALRAKQGPGLMVTGGCSPDVAGRAEPDGFSIESDDLIAGHREIVDAVHAAGPSKIALQLLHAGREAFHGRLVAPSALRLPGSLFAPVEMTHDQILETVDAYARAAERAVEAGYDAIELIFSQGFLVHQFLAGHTNLREDEWGGTPERRRRFALRVAASVRQAVGPRYPIVFRIPCLDLVPGGLSFEDSMALVEALRPLGVDLLNISIGWHESVVPTLANAAPQAAFASAAGRVKARFPQLLTCVSNRINDLRQAEALLLEGVADMAALGRPFLADRRIVEKSAAGRFDEVNPCIACNQDCLDHMFLGKEVGCSVNVDCGSPQDGLDPTALPADTRVAVVGGGLAGLSAAWHLCRRGAAVTLFERSDRLGGQMLLAARIPSKREFARTVDHLVRQVRRHGARVLLERAFTPAEVAAGRWDHVVIATGTTPRFGSPADLFGEPADDDGSVAVVNGYDLLRHDLPVAFPVVIYGGGGVACDIAKFLAHRPSHVDVAEAYLRDHDAQRFVGPLPPLATTAREITIAQRSSKKIGYRIGRTTRWIALNQLEADGVRLLRSASLQGIAGGELVFRMPDGVHRIAAGTLVVATGQEAAGQDVVRALAEAGVPFDVVGAAASTASEPASISASIRSGHRAAMNLTVGTASPEPAMP